MESEDRQTLKQESASLIMTTKQSMQSLCVYIVSYCLLYDRLQICSQHCTVVYVLGVCELPLVDPHYSLTSILQPPSALLPSLQSNSIF